MKVRPRAHGVLVVSPGGSRAALGFGKGGVVRVEGEGEGGGESMGMPSGWVGLVFER